MSVTITQTVRLKPWQVPNFAGIEMPPGLKQEGFKELPTIAIKDLDYEALCGLAEQWLRELFSKANRPNPFKRPEASQ